MKIANMMKQAQAMQAKMKEMQEKLADMTVEGQSGGSMVRVTMYGNGVVSSVKLDDNLIDRDEKDVLEDLIVAAVNDARERVETLVSEKTQEIMGGVDLPGGLPF